MQFWADAIVILKKMKYFSHRKNSFVTVPSLVNLIRTIEGFVYICKYLLYTQNFNYILTRAFNQDALENFFGAIRSHGVRHVSPDASHFETSFKALVINNFMTSHSPNANCMKDFSVGALNNLKQFLEKISDQSEDINTGEPSQISLPADVQLHKRTKIAACVYVYIAGYLVKCLKKKIKCKDCMDNLLYFNEQVRDVDFIEARRYEETSRLIKAGSFLNHLVQQSFAHLFFLIPRVCHIDRIGARLETILENQINFAPINCHIHNSGKIVRNLIVKCSLFFWCKRVNKILKGNDSKFTNFIKRHPDGRNIDPIKVIAYKKMLNFRKTK